MKNRSAVSHNKKWKAHLQFTFAKMMALGPIRKMFVQFGELSEYENWKRSNLPSKLFQNREKLWNNLIPLFNGVDLVVFEFGVAHGYATKWWLKHLEARSIEWHGFDVFTGLPTAWVRGGVDAYSAGAFDARGLTPEIDDERIFWHVGDVAQTLPSLSNTGSNQPTLYLFDFDLGDPTLFCFLTMKHRIKTGDVFYFDEAFDAWNERRVIEEQFMKFFKIESLGSTATALAFKIDQVY